MDLFFTNHKSDSEIRLVRCLYPSWYTPHCVLQDHRLLEPSNRSFSSSNLRFTDALRAFRGWRDWLHSVVVDHRAARAEQHLHASTQNSIKDIASLAFTALERCPDSADLVASAADTRPTLSARSMTFHLPTCCRICESLLDFMVQASCPQLSYAKIIRRVRLTNTGRWNIRPMLS